MVNNRAMSKTKIILTHVTLFILLSIALFFSAESILKTFAPDIHHVQMWITFIFLGTATIFILLLISCILFILKSRKSENRP